MKKHISLVIITLFCLSVFNFGCKAETEMQNKLVDLDNKLADAQKKIALLESENKKINFELTQVKGSLTRLGNVAADMQKTTDSLRATRAKSPSTKPTSKNPSLPTKKKSTLKTKA